MREILFRGKRVDNDEWIEGYYLKNGNMDCLAKHNNVVEQMLIIPVVSETVGQYTGMHDKNNKKIFEGDILECTDFDEETSLHKVYFDCKDEKWALCRSGCFDWTSDLGNFYTPYIYKVVGNIFDNPELWKEYEDDDT